MQLMRIGEKMKISLYKRLLYIFLTLVIIFIVGYVFFTGGNLQ